VGTLGRRLLGIENRNTFDGRTSGATIRPNPFINNDNARGNYYGSNYNAFEATLRKRFSQGLSLNASYTYSKALDEISDVFRPRNGASNISATDVQNLKNDYGRSYYDLRHRVVVSFNYDLPVFHGNRFLGGWTVNSIISWNTGAPIGLVDGTSDANHDGTRSDRPEFIGPRGVNGAINSKPKQLDANGKPVYQYLDPTQFAQSTTCLTNPAINNHGGLWCDPNLSRNAISGPSYANVDFGISKSFKLNERAAFRFDGNFFDLFNHPNFLNPGALGGGNSFTNNGSTFGQSLNTAGDTGGHRITQLAIRFDF
jgi:hypothetical protein